MFRMQLWSALLQTWEESFRYPGTLETTQRVKEMSWHNWQCYNYDKYNLDQNDLPPGKLLLYPIQVNPAPRPNFWNWPLWNFIYCRIRFYLFIPSLIFQVSHYGEVSNLDMFKSFPDYPDTAKVMGGKSGVSLLDKVTTWSSFMQCLHIYYLYCFWHVWIKLLYFYCMYSSTLLVSFNILTMNWWCIINFAVCCRTKLILCLSLTNKHI